MIIMDHEGEILLDIAELSLATTRRAKTLMSKLEEKGWTQDQVTEALVRVHEIKTNDHEEGRDLPEGLSWLDG